MVMKAEVLFNDTSDDRSRLTNDIPLLHVLS